MGRRCAARAISLGVACCAFATACTSGGDQVATGAVPPPAPSSSAITTLAVLPTDATVAARTVASPLTTSPATAAGPLATPPTTVLPAAVATTTSAPTTLPPPTLPPPTLPPTTLPPTTLAPATTVRPPPAPPAPPPASPPPPLLPAELPQPIEAPEDSNNSEPRFELGSIEIPAIGLARSMFEGIRLPTLDRGPGHWPGTAMPGEVGNVVVAGHRVSNNQDFRNLDDLDPGDEVIFNTGSGRHVYVVESTEIVGPDALWIVDQTPDYRGTLFACHPPGSTRERIVVHLRLA